MKRNLTFLAMGLAGLAATAPAIADPDGYPNGHGWQAVEADFEALSDAVSGIGGDLEGLEDLLETLQQSVDDVQDSLDAVVSVDSESSTAFAVEGNDLEALILVRVEQMAMGVGGLDPSAFGMISQQVAPAGCTAMFIDEASPLGPPGSYSLRLVPAVAGNVWCAGTYIATLTVDTGSGVGSALVKVDVPAAP